MKRAILGSAAVLLFTAGLAFAGPGSGETKQPADPPSGRPSAVLDEAKCTSVWSMTEREGDTLSEGKAAPYIVNFKLVDADGDGKISEAEFKDGCKKGLVQEASANDSPSRGAMSDDGAPASGSSTGAPTSKE